MRMACEAMSARYASATGSTRQDKPHIWGTGIWCHAGFRPWIGGLKSAGVA